MVKITYVQNCCQNSQKTIGNYFYVRTHSLDKFDFKGEWHLPNNTTFSVYRSEHHNYPVSKEFWICAVNEDLENERIGTYPSGDLASIEGKFRIITEANHDPYSSRLMQWWNAGDGSIAYAELCAKYLKPRIMQIPQFELDNLQNLDLNIQSRKIPEAKTHLDETELQEFVDKLE